MIKNPFKKPLAPVFTAQREIDEFVAEMGDKYLVPLGFTAYAGRKWVARSADGQFFKVIGLPLLAGHFDYSPVLSYSLPFVPNVKAALDRHTISLPKTASSVSLWQMPYVPYWSATAKRDIAGLPKHDWTIKLRYDKYGAQDFFMPKQEAIEKVFKALSREVPAYFGQTGTLLDLAKLYRQAAADPDGFYRFVSDFNENVATFRMAYALLLKKLKQQDAAQEYQQFLDSLVARHNADQRTLTLLHEYFQQLD